VPVPFQLRVAARLIATLGLVGFCTEGAMAQSAPQLKLAALTPTEMMAEPALSPCRKPFSLAITNSLLETQSPNYFGSYVDSHKTSSIANDVTHLSSCDSSAISNMPASGLIALRLAPNISRWTESGQASKSRNAVRSVRWARLNVSSNFIAAYESLRKSLGVGAQSLIGKYAALFGTAIVGAASTYNPYYEGINFDEIQTASGELYNPAAWTAAIRIDLRQQFGGIRYGKDYQPAFALVESGERKAIIRINDVGPLGHGRVIDLNERSMRYFDPTEQRGLISDVKVTLLPGEYWTPGPIDSEQLLSIAAAK
jgi:peptidoglycan lytic transglycosylase